MWHDLRFSLRLLVRQPSFSIVVGLTLALGIGGSTALFSVVNSVLLRPLPYPDANQIYLVRTIAPDGSITGDIRPPEFKPFYEARQHDTVAAAAIAWSQEVQIIGADDKPHPTTRYGVSDQFFEVFGTRMALGEAFKRGQRPGGVVLAYPIWRDLFASDPKIIGRTVMVEGGPRQVVGVARPDFEFPENPGFWYLMALGDNYDTVRGYRGFARLRTGRTREQFQAELTQNARALGPDPATQQSSLVMAQPFLDHVVGDLGFTVRLLFAATGVLLLIACINVTNLMLSRTGVRAREIALREAVGAGRWRVIRQLLIESLVFTVPGGLLGLAAAAASVRVLLRLAPEGLPRLDGVTLDSHVMLFALAITIATGVLIGLVPAWRLARNPLRTLVNEAGRGATDTASSHRTFSTLVVTEIALAVLLTIGAGLLVRTYLNLAATNPGFDAERVLTFFMYVPGRTEVKILPPANRGERPIFIGSYQPLADFLRGLRERLSGMAGVESVATTSSLPLDRTQYDPLTDFQVVGGNDGAANEAVRTARTRGISPELFRALKIRLLQGRALLPTDRAGGPGVAVVNQTFVRRFLPGGSPLGRRLHYTTNLWKAGEVGFQLGQRTVDDLEIVGVVDDVKYLALGDPAEPSIYLSTEQWTNRRQTIVVRTTSADPAALIPAIRTEIESMDRLLTADFSVYTPIIAASMASQRLAATLLVLFGIVALALATVGVYGLMSYSVAQRTGEIAVRSAMGASQRDVLGLVLGRGVRLAAAGVLGGVVAAIIMRQVIAGRLYGVSPLDPRVFLVAAASLFVVATVGCLLPARRAAAIDPAEVFRQES